MASFWLMQFMTIDIMNCRRRTFFRSASIAAAFATVKFRFDYTERHDHNRSFVPDVPRVERVPRRPATIGQKTTTRRVCGEFVCNSEETMSDEFSEDKFVTIFSSRQHSAEIEAETINGLLESAGMRSMIVRDNVRELPVGKVSVRVFASEEEEAREIIEEARAAGNSADDQGDSE